MFKASTFAIPERERPNGDDSVCGLTATPIGYKKGGGRFVLALNPWISTGLKPIGFDGISATPRQSP